MPNLLHLINDSSQSRGGAQKVLAKLNSIETLHMGLKIKVFSKNRIESQVSEEQVVGGPFWFLNLFSLIFYFRPSVVVLHSRLFLPFVYFLRLFNCHVIYYCHARYRRFPWVFKVFQCNQYIAVSESVNSYLSQYISVDKIFVNYNPIEIQFPECNLLLDKITFNYVGSLQRWKGIDMFLNYISLYAEEHHLQADINIVGEGPLREKIELMSMSDGININMVGYCTSPYDILNANGIHVVPSLEEGFGMVAVEAVQNGSVILHTDIPALNEVLFGDEYSYSYTPNNYLSFCDAVNSLLDDASTPPSRDLLRDRSESARLRFGLTSFIKRYTFILSKNIRVFNE